MLALLRPCAAAAGARPQPLARRRAPPLRRPAPRVRRARAAPEGEGPPEGPAEPADDPSRPAASGRSAYDEDRAAFYPAKKAGPKAPKDEGQRRIDDAVSGGRYGYGPTVDTAFKYLASEGSFLVGALLIVLAAVAVLANGPPPSLLD